MPDSMASTQTTPKKAKRPRTYARNRSFSRRGREKLFESDSNYFFKLVVVLLLGTLWLKLSHPLPLGPLPLTGIPIGLLLGVLLVHRFEPLQSDRKIWYAILLITTILTYFFPAGIVI